ncbi:MAG TPA: hypothetical protein VM531_07320 [Sphingomicrobium sp.]|jgi:hypothetical protein|nr:hypothetical protein [Sphingomicrobium sp.]
MAEPVSLQEAKDYLRILDTTEDTKVSEMIPRARRWVEDHTGHALVQRAFVEGHTPRRGRVQLDFIPVLALSSVTYRDGDGVQQSYSARHFPPGALVFANLTEAWPLLNQDEEFTFTYTAGPDASNPIDPRHVGAILALVEGEYSEGYAYPERAIEAAKLICQNARTVVV